MNSFRDCREKYQEPEDHKESVRTYREVAEIMTERGHPMTRETVYDIEQTALSKLKILLEGRELPKRTHKGTPIKGEKVWKAKLTEADIRQIRSRSDRGVDLAEEFGVSRKTICDIQKRRSWKHVK